MRAGGRKKTIDDSKIYAELDVENYKVTCFLQFLIARCWVFLLSGPSAAFVARKMVDKLT